MTLCRLSKKFRLITDEFHNFRFEHSWNHDFYAQESNIIFDIISIFFSMFSMFFFDIFFRLKVNSIFCLIRCVDVKIFRRFDVRTFRCFVFRCLVTDLLCRLEISYVYTVKWKIFASSNFRGISR